MRKKNKEGKKVNASLIKKDTNTIILYPGFNHTDIAELFHELEGKVAINVSRGDGPNSKTAQEALDISEEFLYNVAPDIIELTTNGI